MLKNKDDNKLETLDTSILIILINATLTVVPKAVLYKKTDYWSNLGRRESCHRRARSVEETINYINLKLI